VCVCVCMCVCVCVCACVRTCVSLSAGSPKLSACEREGDGAAAA
jgi:hypothetical protein